MRQLRRLWELVWRLHAILGGPGLMIGGFALLSFGFGLYVLAREYDRPRQTGRDVVHRIVGVWVRMPDYLGRTLVDYVDDWRSAPPAERPASLKRLGQGLDRLGAGLDRQSEQFPLIHVVSMDLESPGSGRLARWALPVAADAAADEVTDRLTLTTPGATPSVTLTLRYRVVPTFEDGVRALEISYRRLLLALIGLSGFSLLCLAYMILHARALSERVAREAAQEATLDLADRTCHELGNGVFVLTNERRNLAEHLDLVERFVAESPEALAAAARRAGVDGEHSQRLTHALRREYAGRGIDPEVELRASAALARHVCRQIAVCSEYIGLTVRELDGFLKRSATPVKLEAVDVAACADEALSLLHPRIEATEGSVVLDFGPAAGVAARADRRLLIHALVNLVKNAVEAAAGRGVCPEVRVSARVEGRVYWLTVSDNGPGVPPEALKRIFDLGYTTKGSGRGRGLSIVRESVLLQEGEILVGSRPGDLGGAEFRVGLAVDPGTLGHVSISPTS